MKNLPLKSKLEEDFLKQLLEEYINNGGEAKEMKICCRLLDRLSPPEEEIEIETDTDTDTDSKPQWRERNYSCDGR